MSRTESIGGCRIAFLLPLLSLCANPSCGGNDLDPEGQGNLASQAIDLCASMETEGIRYGDERVNAVKAGKGLGVAVCHYLPSDARDKDWHYRYAALQLETRQEHQTLESMREHCQHQGLELDSYLTVMWFDRGFPVSDHPVVSGFLTGYYSPETMHDIYWGAYHDNVLCGVESGSDASYPSLGEIPCDYWCTTGDWRPLDNLPELISAE